MSVSLLPRGKHVPAGSPQFPGALLLGSPDTHEAFLRRQVTQLIRVGGRLAILGVEDGPRSMTWWHVAQPGSWTAPQGKVGTDHVYATALCRRVIVTNGYAADFRPPKGSLCPACAEQL